MSKVFEDEFMDLHSSIISLCKEVKADADKIFAYCSIEDGAYEFHAMFLKSGKVLRLSEHDLGVSNALLDDFLHYGIEDTKAIDAVCKKHGRPTPTEIKMIYDVKTRRFDAQYQYQPVQSLDRGTPDIMDEWEEEILSGLQRENAAAPKNPQKTRRWFPFFGKK